MFAACESCHEAEHEGAKYSRYMAAVLFSRVGICTSFDYLALSELLIKSRREYAGNRSPLEELIEALQRFKDYKAARIGAGEWYEF